jgi:N-acetylglutamate synthase-like GNAT family acetyltransferase
MDIQIRKAKTTDVSAISNLLRSLNLFALINNEEGESTRQRVQKHFDSYTLDDNHLILVAQTASGEITGYCAVHWLPYLILAGPEGYVSELFIKEEFRGQGVGNSLLEAIKIEAQNRGCSRLMLLNIRNRDSYKRQFYSKHGWEERPDAANFVFQLINHP